jgi:O-antigen/teichoic acid export membrane protein
MEKIKEFIISHLIFVQDPWFKKVLQAIFTQGMLSAANFVAGFAVAKFATKEQYGIFVILFSIMGIIGNYQGALINAPMTVLSPKKEVRERELLVSGLGYGQWLFFLPIIFLSFLGAAAYCLVYFEISILKYLAALSFASLGLLLREFIRTVNYSRARIDVLVKTDAVFVLIITAGFFMLGLKGGINSVSSITIFGAGYFVSSIAGLRYGNYFYESRWKSVKSALKETWQYSRWACVGVTSNLMMNNGYIYLTLALLGLRELAEISAARLFIGPVNLFVSSSSKIVLAQGADLLATKGVKKFKEYVLVIAGMLILIGVVYFLCLSFLCDYIISILGAKYLNIKHFIFWWGVFCLMNLLRFPISNALLVLSEFKSLASFDIIGAIATLVTCIALTITLGGDGAIISLIVGESTMLILSALRLFVLRSDEGKPLGN